MQPGSGVNITFLSSLWSLQQSNSIDSNLAQLQEIDMLNLLLYGDAQLNDSPNKILLSRTIQFIISFERFNGPFI